MLIDLHTHSSASDGTDSPSELMANAALAGLDVIALSDHDSMSGWDEAQTAAQRHGLTLVRGLEVSCTYRGASVHLLGYEPDPGHEAMRAELRRVLHGRVERLPRILRKLANVGVHLTEDEVADAAGRAAASGRPHVADAMIRRGYVADRDEAFERYLKPGRPGYVDRYAADLPTMIELINDAGGVAVLAHPWSRGSWRVLDAKAFAELRQVGLAGIEVDHVDHEETKRRRLRGIAADLDLVVTGSSDYHGDGKTGYYLGCNTTRPGEYERLLRRRRE